jgi:hypothetical protein
LKYVQLFGERCSGTNFLESLIRKNFRGLALTKEFGGKHWFIKDHHPRCRPNHSTDYQCIRRLTDSADTLFLCLFRNPYDWLRSLNARPYHAGRHWGLPFSDFIRDPWHSWETTRVHPAWPDRADNYWFIEDAENILRLRTRKILHLLGLEQIVDHVYMLRYEDLRDDPQILIEIAKRYGIAMQGPNVVGERRHFGQGGSAPFAPRQYPKIRDSDLSFIADELDWSVESRIGYTKTDYSAGNPT